MSSTNTSASDSLLLTSSRVAYQESAWPFSVAGGTVPSELTTPGSGALRIGRRGDVSVAERVCAASPLRLLTPRNHGGAAWVFTSSFGGGLVDGDRQFLDVEVGAGASAYLSTQASTKVYRSVRGATVELRARVDEQALLVLAPDPVVCFADSRFHQRQEFDLAASASLVAVDWVTSGRRESGERWAFASYTSHLIARLDRRLVVHDAMALRREDGDLGARMGRFDVLAIVLVLGTPLLPHATALVHGLENEPVRRTPSLLAVATPVTHQQFGTVGCVLRIAGQSVEAVGVSIRSALSFVPPLLGDDPWLRKW
jgi:urease accessory protein